MAFSAGVVWEVRQAGSDSNGGGFRGGANLTTPSIPTVNGSASGGTIAAGTYYVVITESDGNGETPKSPERTVVLTGTTSSMTVVSPTNPNILGSSWNVYVGTTSGGPYFIQSTGLTFGVNRSITTTPPTTGTQAPGVNYSQQDAAQVSLADMVIDGTTNTLFTSATLGTNANYVGNIINQTGGTGFTVQPVEILGMTAAGKYTVDKSLGTLSSTGGTGNLGGGLASMGRASLANVGNGVFVKYSATPIPCSATVNAPGGSFSSNNPQWIVGYDTTRDRGNTDINRPTIQVTANSAVPITLGRAGAYIANIIVDGNGKTGVTAFSPTAALGLRNCKALNCGTGYTSNGSTHIEDCEANGCITGHNGAGTARLVAFAAINCTTTGILLGASGQATDCIAVNCPSGFVAGGTYGLFMGCISYGHTISGFSITSSGPNGGFTSCISYGAGGTAKGFVQSGTPTDSLDARLVNCAAGNNGGGNVVGSWYAINIASFITLTGDPFTNAAGGDFSLNTGAGGGALLRAAGYPSRFPGLNTTNYRDVGAPQHSDASAATLALSPIGCGFIKGV